MEGRKLPLINTQNRFTPSKPAKFQVGDLVEVQVSLVAIPQQERKLKTVMILRSITLMDGRFSQVSSSDLSPCHTSGSQYEPQAACTARLTKRVAPSQAKGLSMKRRVGYGDEELANARNKLSRMEIDENEKTTEDNNIDRQAGFTGLE